MKAKVINDVEKEKKEVRSTIICIDDEKMMLSVLYEQLTEWFGKNYKIEKALSGEEALEIVDRCVRNDETISVVISDYVMPVMKGDELLIEIRKRDPKIKKIMLTGYTSVSGIISAINQAGLYRFISKPWDQKDLMLTIMEAIKSYEQERKMQELAKGFESLYRRCEEGNQHTIDALVSAVQAVNPEMASHSARVKQYSLWLGKKLELDETICKNIKYASVLHNIGKLGSNKEADSRDPKVLLEQADTAKKIISHLDEPEQILKGVQYQFENYDGSGPYKVKGDNIPVEARILAIAHYYDWLKTKAPNLQVAQVIEKFYEKRGTWFDPKYVDEFIKILAPVK